MISSKNSITRRDFLKITTAGCLSFAGLPLFRNRSYPSIAYDSTLPNILIIVFDTLSANNMSLYGYPRHTTPHIETAAETAKVFHQHYAGGNFTPPGTSSLLTGMYPWSHRAFQMHGQPLPLYRQENIFSWMKQVYFNFAYTHNPSSYIILHNFRHSIHQLFHISDLALYAQSPSEHLFFHDYATAYQAELLTFRNGYHPPASLFSSLYDWLSRIIKADQLNKAASNHYPYGLPNLYDEEAPSFYSLH